MNSRSQISNRMTFQSVVRNIHSLQKGFGNCVVSMRESTGIRAFLTDRGNANWNLRPASANVRTCLDFSTWAPRRSQTQAGRDVTGAVGAWRIKDHRRSGKRCRQGFLRTSGLSSKSRRSARSAKARLSNNYPNIFGIRSFAKSWICGINQYLLTIKPSPSNHATKQPANQGRQGLRLAKSKVCRKRVQQNEDGFGSFRLPAESQATQMQAQGRGDVRAIPLTANAKQMLSKC